MYVCVCVCVRESVCVCVCLIPRVTLLRLFDAAPRHAPRNLQVGERTTHSLEASWELEDPLVEGYRVSYATPERAHSPEVVSVLRAQGGRGFG